MLRLMPSAPAGPTTQLKDACRGGRGQHGARTAAACSAFLRGFPLPPTRLATARRRTLRRLGATPKAHAPQGMQCCRQAGCLWGRGGGVPTYICDVGGHLHLSDLCCAGACLHVAGHLPRAAHRQAHARAHRVAGSHAGRRVRRHLHSTASTARRGSGVHGCAPFQPPACGTCWAAECRVRHPPGAWTTAAARSAGPAPPRRPCCRVC